jgi:hypothetical protein
MRATHVRIQPNSVWAGTWDWTKRVTRSGSRPQARSSAVFWIVALFSSSGFHGSVIAWRSTMQYRESCSSWVATQFLMAPK